MIKQIQQTKLSLKISTPVFQNLDAVTTRSFDSMPFLS